MEKEFVPYEQALELKELGFSEECFSYYDLNNKPNFFGYDNLMDTHCVQVNRPTFSQAFRWFREKYDLVAAILPFQDIEDRVSLCYYYSIVDLDECKDEDILCNESSLGASDINFSSHPEAELACLEKLIEIVEKQK